MQSAAGSFGVDISGFYQSEEEAPMIVLMGDSRFGGSLIQNLGSKN